LNTAANADRFGCANLSLLVVGLLNGEQMTDSYLNLPVSLRKTIAQPEKSP